MESAIAGSSQVLGLFDPWPVLFALDFGRYLLAALAVTVALAAIPRRVLDLRRVRRRLPDMNQRWHELRHSIIAAVVFSLVGLSVYHGARHGIFRICSQPIEYGWLYWAGSLVLIVVAHDAYFYWTHRWMHRPDVFRRIHRTHHTSVAPTQWAAYSFSIGEAAVQAAFLPLFLLIVPTHSSVLFIWMAHQVIRNVAGHCGFELEPKTWLASWWGRWLTTTLHHDMHHEHGRHNYGLYFTWWDKWCGTEHPQYRNRLALVLADDAPRAIAVRTHEQEV